MTNWETSKSFFDKINVAHFDVPNEVIDYLKDPKSISQKIPYNKNLIGHIKGEYHYDEIPNMVADFLIEKTKYTSYCIDNWDLVKDKKDWNRIYCKEGNKFKRKDRFIDSYTVKC